MRIATFTVDLRDRIPVAPLRAVIDVPKMGRRVGVVEVTLHDEASGRAVGGAAALLVRTGADLDVPVGPPIAERPPLPTSVDLLADYPGFTQAFAFNRLHLDDWSGGPRWMRLRLPLVAGHEPSPLVRLATVADMASGWGSPLSYETHVTINPNLVVSVLRAPRTDWIGIEAATEIDGDGIGLTTGSLFDVDGRVAGVQASLYAAHRDRR